MKLVALSADSQQKSAPSLLSAPDNHLTRPPEKKRQKSHTLLTSPNSPRELTPGPNRLFVNQTTIHPEKHRGIPINLSTHKSTNSPPSLPEMNPCKRPIQPTYRPTTGRESAIASSEQCSPREKKREACESEGSERQESQGWQGKRGKEIEIEGITRAWAADVSDHAGCVDDLPGRLHEVQEIET